MSPLETVYRTQIAFSAVGETDRIEIGAGAIAVPNFYASRRKGERRGRAGYEPKEFSNDCAQEDAFGGEKREDGGAGGRGEGELEGSWGEERDGPCASSRNILDRFTEGLRCQVPIRTVFSGLENLADEV